MSEEIWKHYRPIEDLDNDYYAIKTDDSPEGLRLLFSSYKDTSKGIEVIFEHSYESYRSTEEGGRYRTLCKLIDRYGKDYMASSVLYIVENSRYVDWLIYESCDVREKEELFHFVFLSTGVYVDVIAMYHPKIIHVDLNKDHK